MGVRRRQVVRAGAQNSLLASKLSDHSTTFAGLDVIVVVNPFYSMLCHHGTILF